MDLDGSPAAGRLSRDDSNGWTLVTSRTPDDLDAFVAAAVEAFAG